MPLNPSDPSTAASDSSPGGSGAAPGPGGPGEQTRPTTSRSLDHRRTGRIGLAGVAVAVLLVATWWADTRRGDQGDRADRVRLDAVQTASPILGRASRGRNSPVPPPARVDPEPAPVPEPVRPLPASTDPLSPTTTSQYPAPAGRATSAGSALPGTNPVDAPAAGGPDHPDAASASSPTGTFWLPGTQVEAPITGPLADLPDDGEDELVEVPSPTPQPPPADEEVDPPDPDEVGCPNLGLLPIGGFDDGESSTYGHLHALFRAVAPAEWAADELVCGHPLEPWRDLVVQRLVTGGRADGAIVTAADGSSIALRLTEAEWGTYRFRYGGGPTGVNLLGYPVGRLLLDGIPVIRTTGGGMVFAQADALGVPVIGGLWDLWTANGGPGGFMGLPLGVPESATGPTGATTWQPGLVSTGARQSFQHGWVFLPGVISDVDAAAQPADRYQWYPWSALPPDPEPTIDYRGHIMKLGPTTWYVDTLGIRHWIPTASQWMCATWDLKATQYLVEAYELEAYPLGDTFQCEQYKTPIDGDPPLVVLTSLLVLAGPAGT